MSSAAQISGWVAFVVTVVYMALGLPSQIARNRRRRSVEGQSLLMFALMNLTGVSWVVYAALQQTVDWYIAASNTTGVAFSSIILYQFWAFRGRRAED